MSAGRCASRIFGAVLAPAIDTDFRLRDRRQSFGNHALHQLEEGAQLFVPVNDRLVQPNRCPFHDGLLARLTALSQ